mgnify:FL=1|jgi:multiple sugar transport system permease protein
MKNICAKRRAVGGRRNQIILNIVLFILLIILLLPFWWCLVLSFDKTAITDIPNFSLLPHVFTLDNYKYAMESISLGRYFLNTTFVVLVNTGLTVFFALLCGYAFAKGRFAGKKVCYYLMLAVMMIPFESRMIPLYLMYRSMDMLNTYWPLILGSFAYVYGTFLARQNIAVIPDSLRESAKIDGASEWKVFFRIILPLCKPVASALAILQIVAQWNAYLWPMIVIRSREMQLLSVGVAFLNADEYHVYIGPRMAIIVLSSLPLIIIFLFLQKYIVQSVALSGVKE